LRTPPHAGNWRRRGHVDELPAEPGRDITAILAAAADRLDALLIGVDRRPARPHTALAAIEAAGFVVSLELREPPSPHWPMWFPVAPVEKAGLRQLGGRPGRSSRR
jgi:NADH-quinone oxidoreductase subunit G